MSDNKKIKHISRQGWAKMEILLDTHMPQNKEKRRPIIWFWAGAACFFLVASMTLYHRYSKDTFVKHAQSPLVIKSNGNENIQSSILANKSSDSVDKSSNTNTKGADLSIKEHRPDLNITAKNSNIVENTSLYNLDHSRLNTAPPTDVYVENKLPLSSTEEKQAEQINQIYQPTSILETQVSQIISSTNASTDAMHDTNNEVIIKEGESQINLALLTQKNASSLIHTDEKLALNLAIEPSKTILVKKTSDRSVYLGASASLLSNLSSSNVPAFGVLLGCKISPKFNAELGVSFFKNKEYTLQTQYIRNLFQTNGANYTEISSILTSNNYNVLLPLSFGYVFHKNFKIRVGGYYNYSNNNVSAVSNEPKTSVDFISTLELVEVTLNNQLKQGHLGYIIGLSYDINPRFGVGIDVMSKKRNGTNIFWDVEVKRPIAMATVYYKPFNKGI